MPSIEGDLDRLVLYLRAYKYVINDPENKTLYPPDVRSKDELEQKIKTLFISLMGSSAAIREQEEAKRIKKEEIDAELKRAIKEIINEGVGGDYQRQIKNELITLRGLLTQTSKSEEIKSELRALRETVNTKALSSERIKKLIVPYIKI
jgi:DNA-directed RNA polymerase beta' subunit